MNEYELMVVFRPDYPADDQKSLNAFLTKLTGGATLTSVNVLGKKHLAYPIKKMGVAGMQKEGIYVLVRLQGAPIKIGAIEKEVSMGNDVLRYLLTVQKEAN